MHTLVLADDGLILGAGSNDLGQLGLGLRGEWPMPAAVVAWDGRCGAGGGESGGLSLGSPRGACRGCVVSCGFNHSLVLTRAGSVWVLGGRGGRSSRPPEPAADSLLQPSCGLIWRVRGPLERVHASDVAGGGGHALCLANDSIFSFGAGCTSGPLSGVCAARASPTPRVVPVMKK